MKALSVRPRRRGRVKSSGESAHEPRQTILIADNDPTTCQVLTLLLESEGFTVARASNGVECLKMVAAKHPDLILLDILLPLKDGRQVCREIRQTGSTPIIMLSALTAEPEKAGRLNDGADDYVSKPYDNQELLARIRAVLRRADSNADRRRYRDNKLDVDFDAHVLAVDGKRVTLSPKEWRLLEFLHRHQGRTVGRKALLRHVWGKEYEESHQYLKVFISKMRRKLGESAQCPRYILTKYDAGYRFQSQP